VRPLDKAAIPAFGLIEDDKAAGFLVRTELNIALLDNFVTNPDAKLRHRHAALKIIAWSLCREAQERGYTVIAATTQSHGIVMIGEALGFKNTGLYCGMQREL